MIASRRSFFKTAISLGVATSAYPMLSGCATSQAGSSAPLIDHWLGTRPWGLLILLCLGLVAGFRLMLRTAESHAKRSAENMDADGKDAESAKKG